MSADEWAALKSSVIPAEAGTHTRYTYDCVRQQAGLRPA